jgi:RNA exonuclease 4
MARGNKFKPKVDEPAPAATLPSPPQPAASPPSPARDGTHAASTTAAAAVTAGQPPVNKRKRGSSPSPPSGAPAAKKATTTTTTRLAVPTLVAPPTAAAKGSTTVNVGAANWLALKAAASIGKKHAAGGKKAGHARPPTTTTTPTTTPATHRAPPPPHLPQPALPAAIGSTTAPTRVLAMDCEMVGVGPGGARSALARVCIVNDAGAVLLDTHVAPRERVTDYRTRVSGVTPACLRGAPDLGSVRERVERLIAGRVLVGHAITHDLTALMVSHPRSLVRDTARYPPLMRVTAAGRRPKPRRLRDLAAEVLGLAIQGGAHSPVDDARAALYLYQRCRREWEAAARKPGGVAKHTAAPVRVGGRVAMAAATASAEAALGALAAEDDMADL